MSWFVITIFILSFTFNNKSEARNLNKLYSAVVVGRVHCYTCIQDGVLKITQFIPGALVAVECGNEISKPIFHREAKTNENGEFEVHLSMFVAKHIKKVEGCSVKLLKSDNPLCNVTSLAISSTPHLKSQKQGIQIFSAGQFTFMRSNQPKLCNQKPRKEILNPRAVDFPPPINDPAVPFIPPIPDLPQIPPLPNLPPLPPLSKIPISPSKATDSSSKVKVGIVQEDTTGGTVIPQNQLVPSPPSFFGIPFPPNPFQSPPTILPPIPNPFQPPSPPSIPSLIPSPLPLPPPVFPIRFPSFLGFPSASLPVKNCSCVNDRIEG